METLSLRLGGLDETVTVDVEALPAQARLDELLPALRILDDQAMNVVTRKDGRLVTCAKGCAQCCRIQLVPITPAEAYALWLLVENLEEPMRSEIRERFRERVVRLEAAGLADFFRSVDAISDSAAMRVNLQRYLDIELACPFLEGEVCGIYEFRPFSCREYMVTTVKELCRDPLSGAVAVLPRILPVAGGMMEAAEALGAGGQRMLPLILALEYAEAHRSELEKKYPSGMALSQTIARVFMQAYRNRSLVP